jgi:hypothetical protein
MVKFDAQLESVHQIERMVNDVGGRGVMLGSNAEFISMRDAAIVPDNTADGLFRKTANNGEFAGLKVPMQMRYVDQAAADAGIGLQGVKVRIVRDPELIGRNTFGYTHPDGSIDLYPDAFTDTEQLVKTLGHERTHTMQIDIFGHPNTHGDNVMSELMQNENAAHGVEDSFWQYYLRNNSGRLEEFR